MISRVSFGSSYNVSTENNTVAKYNEFKNYAYEISKKFKGEISTRSKDSFNLKPPYEYKADCTLKAPNVLDKSIEAFCRVSGIKFTKLGEIAINQNNISQRILPSPEGYSLVYINPTKLEKLMTRQTSNIITNELVYNEYMKNDVMSIIKTNEKFPTAKLQLQPTNKTTDEYIMKLKGNHNTQYIRTNKDLFIDLEMDEKNRVAPFVYFALRNMGIQKIPMYVDKDSYAIGKELNLFEEPETIETQV